MKMANQKKCKHCGETKQIDVPPFDQMTDEDIKKWKGAGNDVAEICPNGCE